MKKLNIQGADAVAIGDTPYDAEAAAKAGIDTIGVLCEGFPERLLRRAGCVVMMRSLAVMMGCRLVMCCSAVMVLARSMLFFWTRPLLFF